MNDLSRRYGKCPECGKYAVHLGTTGVEEFAGDGDDKLGDCSVYNEYLASDSIVQLFAHLCFECGHLVDVGIESPRDKAIDTREYQWSTEWPVEPGAYWFCGFCPGSSEEQMVFVVAFLAEDGNLVYTGNGHSMHKSENCGIWTPANVPSWPVEQLEKMLGQ